MADLEEVPGGDQLIGVVKKEKASGEHELIIDGYKCPDQFVNDFTPLEFEDLVDMFKKYDTDKSGSINVEEMRKVACWAGVARAGSSRWGRRRGGGRRAGDRRDACAPKKPRRRRSPTATPPLAAAAVAVVPPPRSSTADDGSVIDGGARWRGFAWGRTAASSSFCVATLQRCSTRRRVSAADPAGVSRPASFAHLLVCSVARVEVLHDMEMEFSAEEAVELMDKIDKDGSGILDFEEFVMFVGRIKRGDTELKGFAKLVGDLDETPVAVLEFECKRRELKSEASGRERRPCNHRRSNGAP